MQNIDYTSFDKVYHITEQPYALNIYYGIGLNRIEQELLENDIIVKTKIYIGGIYEKTEDNDGNTK